LRAFTYSSLIASVAVPPAPCALTCRNVPGVSVPIPTRPEFCCTVNREAVVSAPAIVDVAFVDVALKYPKVGVEVATICPEEFV
jgi:hypothetical protein